MIETIAGSPAPETETQTTPERRQLTPEQHQQKLLRERERRAAKKLALAEEIALAAAPEREMTQAERDQPYRDRLSAMIKTQDAIRAKRIYESQQRQAASKNVIFR